MSSPALQRKLAKMRQAAPQELPKVRLCADLVHALATGAGEGVVNDALAKLKACAGRNWAAGQAAQYLSGQQAEFAIEFASPEERNQLLAAQLIAKMAFQQAR